MSTTNYNIFRYARQLSLPGIGREGQEKLSNAKVLLIGAGGLGSPAALYLCCAGVGLLGLAEFDHVEISNLQRQILYRGSDAGNVKLDAAARELRARNPDLKLIRHPEGIQVQNALELMSAYDLVLDGSDNFRTRYLVNDAAVLSGTPLISASLFQFEGQISLFSPKNGGPCYRCLFPDIPDADEVPNCAEAGVLGALCGVVGSLQALEALKWISGAGDPLLGNVLTIDTWSQQYRKIKVKRDPTCTVCGESPVITCLSEKHYQHRCKIGFKEEDKLAPEEAADLHDAVWLDVREDYERELCAIMPSHHIPLCELPERIQEVYTDAPVIVYCHHGSRSLHAVKLLKQAGVLGARSLNGGIDQWALTQNTSLARY